ASFTMSGSSSDQLHRSTLRLYMNLMEHFNPGLQKLVSLGNSYVQAFKALAVTGEAYFRAVAKMGEQALHTMTSRSLGDVLMQISESQRRLIAELDGVFQWFHAEVLQEMDNNVRLDGDYISGSMERYEIEVRNQAAALQLQLRRGTYRNSLVRQCGWAFNVGRVSVWSHHDIKLSWLLTGVGLQLKAEGWKELVNETRVSRPRTPSLLDQDTASRSSVNSFLHTGVREEDKERIWTGQEEQALGRVPSRAPSPQPIRARSSSVGETLGMGVGRQMKALAPHLPSSNPTLLPFAQGDLITVLVQEPRNGWLYGRSDSNFRQGWFPAAYVTPLEDTPKIFGS
ncbi:hypothetical protein Z043_115534, partial [Scleropages formosus]